MGGVISGIILHRYYRGAEASRWGIRVSGHLGALLENWVKKLKKKHR